jgi:curved DNA-binding protein CbpA
VNRNFYEILGIKSDAKADEISKAYRKLVLKFHPDRFSDPLEKKKMEETLKEITEAYNTLSNWKLRQEYDKTLETRSVEKTPEEKSRDLFPQALDYYKNGEFKSAESLFSYLSRLTPDDISVKFYLGMCKLYSPLSRMEGAKLVEEALKKDPFHPQWFLEYAGFLRKVGQAIRAKKIIEEGMKVNPNDFDLPEFLKEDNSEIKKGSPLGGLFGKKS